MAAWKMKKAALDAQKAKSAGAQSMFAAQDAPAGLAPAFAPQQEEFSTKMARKQAEAAEREIAHTKRLAEEEDALDAFMDAEVMPEVAAKREEVCCAASMAHVFWGAC
jgi:hypothetical protein